MTSYSSHPLSRLIQAAKDLEPIASFKSTGTPLKELQRLFSLAKDLSTDDANLQMLAQGEKENQNTSNNTPSPTSTAPSTPTPQGNNPLRFESKACGTPIPTPRNQPWQIQPSALDQTFGQELLKTLAQHPLSAESRIEALRRLSVAMANPTRQNLESVMMILITNDPNHNQTNGPR